MLAISSRGVSVPSSEAVVAPQVWQPGSNREKTVVGGNPPEARNSLFLISTSHFRTYSVMSIVPELVWKLSNSSSDGYYPPG